MMKCPKHDAYSLHRAVVRVCPECGRILDAEGLYIMLERLKISHDTIEKIREELVIEEVIRNPSKRSST